MQIQQRNANGNLCAKVAAVYRNALIQGQAHVEGLLDRNRARKERPRPPQMLALPRL